MACNDPKTVCTTIDNAFEYHLVILTCQAGMSRLLPKQYEGQHKPLGYYLHALEHSLLTAAYLALAEDCAVEWHC